MQLVNVLCCVYHPSQGEGIMQLVNVLCCVYHPSQGDGIMQLVNVVVVVQSSVPPVKEMTFIAVSDCVV